MFGIGFQEMLIILVVALIFFGPKRLPDLAKSLGKGIAEFKKASEEVRKGIEDAVKEETVPEPAAPAEDLSAFGRAPGSGPQAGGPPVPEPAAAPGGEAAGAVTPNPVTAADAAPNAPPAEPAPAPPHPAGAEAPDTTPPRA
jgi:TatA/E family protein of Tat protein translocase